MIYFCNNTDSLVYLAPSYRRHTNEQLRRTNHHRLKPSLKRFIPLQHINIRGILQSEIYQLYEDTLQQANDSLTIAEDALTGIGMKLEYEHYRLGGAADEHKPLMIRHHSKSDRVLEILDEHMSALDSNIDPA
jgi:hypothetical protein